MIPLTTLHHGKNVKYFDLRVFNNAGEIPILHLRLE